MKKKEIKLLKKIVCRHFNNTCQWKSILTNVSKLNLN